MSQHCIARRVREMRGTSCCRDGRGEPLPSAFLLAAASGRSATVPALQSGAAAIPNSPVSSQTEKVTLDTDDESVQDVGIVIEKTKPVSVRCDGLNLFLRFVNV